MCIINLAHKNKQAFILVYKVQAKLLINKTYKQITKVKQANKSHFKTLFVLHFHCGKNLLRFMLKFCMKLYNNIYDVLCEHLENFEMHLTNVVYPKTF